MRLSRAELPEIDLTLNQPVRPGLLSCFALFWLLAMAGCAPDHSLPTTADTQEDMAGFSEGSGYTPASQPLSVPVVETLQHAHDPIEVVLLTPAGNGPFPTVLFLPGLGEHAGAAPLWRETWAGAGFAVISVQPDRIAGALRGLARSDEHGDRRDIGRPYFAPGRLEGRLGLLAWTLEEIQRRVTVPGSSFARVDLARLAVAGYELGAQSAAALAGESVRAAIPVLASCTLRASLLLSPFVDLAAGGLNKRFQGIRAPLLVITGSEDVDPYGMSSPSLRPAVWQYAAPGGKYLLNLDRGGRRLLSGNLAAVEEEGDGGDWTDAPETGFSSGSARGGAGLDPRGRYGEGGGPAPGFMHRRPDPRQQAAIRLISTAFLNMTLKSEADARAWLDNDAQRWLGRSAALRRR